MDNDQITGYARKKKRCKINCFLMAFEKFGLHSSCSLILSLQAPVPLDLLPLWWDLFLPSLFLVLCKEMPSKMYNKFSRVFTRGFMSAMCKQGTIFYFELFFFCCWGFLDAKSIILFSFNLQTIATAEAGMHWFAVTLEFVFCSLCPFSINPTDTWGPLM